jgi:hypothetical protein
MRNGDERGLITSGVGATKTGGGLPALNQRPYDLNIHLDTKISRLIRIVITDMLLIVSRKIIPVMRFP